MLSLIISASLLALLLYFIAIKPFKYWEKKNVPQKPLTKVIINLISAFVQRKAFAETICGFYNEFPDKRYSGVYALGQPTLLLRDIELIKQITVKEFDHFTNHQSLISSDCEPLWSNALFNLKGKKWRQMRVTLSPSFTSSKMKTMFVLMSQCAEDFVQFFLKDDSMVIQVDVTDVLTRYANDVIATTAFGIKCDSLKDRENQFYLMGKKVSGIFKGTWSAIKVTIFIMLPTIAKFFRMRLFSSQEASFFSNLIKATMKMREEKNIVRPDMIHLLMEARKGKNKEEVSNLPDVGFATAQDSFEINTYEESTKLTDMDIIAQALAFFFAGFDTVSRSISFAMHEIAVNPDVQEKLFEEIDRSLNACHNKLNYEVLAKMKYLDIVVSEVFRLWPTAIFLERQCVKLFAIKPENGDEVPVTLNIGDEIWVPVFAIHRDPKYYPEPERFDPERFNDENKENIKPYTYMPFGVGPRNCIGSRFALLEMKILLVHVLSKFELTPTEKTQIPMKLNRKEILLYPENGFHLGFKRRTKFLFKA